MSRFPRLGLPFKLRVWGLLFEGRSCLVGGRDVGLRAEPSSRLTELFQAKLIVCATLVRNVLVR
jgi:hypothetical protein